MIVKNRNCEGGKEFWDHVEKVAASVSSFEVQLEAPVNEPADYLDLVLQFAEAVSGSPWGQETPMARWPLIVIERTKELIAKRDKIVAGMAGRGHSA